MDLLKLLCGFLKVVLYISHPFPSKTKQFDQRLLIGLNALRPLFLWQCLEINPHSTRPIHKTNRLAQLIFTPVDTGQATWLNIFLLRIYYKQILHQNMYYSHTAIVSYVNQIFLGQERSRMCPHQSIHYCEYFTRTQTYSIICVRKCLAGKNNKDPGQTLNNCTMYAILCTSQNYIRSKKCGKLTSHSNFGKFCYLC